MEQLERIPYIINRVVCEKHKVPLGIPCSNIRTGTGKMLPAICNHRAMKAGFTGEIDKRSLRGSNG